jgi:phytoene dehydrogenase-like protein
MATAHVIGAGPNGLAAAITLARAGVATTLYEARGSVGGAATSGEVTLPGFRHDLGSSVYPMGVASPFFRSLPLAEHGVRWIEPDAPLAHPLDDGTAVMLEHSVEVTAEGLGGVDGAAYRAMMEPLAQAWPGLVGEILQPVVHVPKHPVALARFGLQAMLPATLLAKMRFKGVRARALMAGNAAHSVMPLESVMSAAVGLVLGTAGHTTGWPIVAGGAQGLSDGLAAIFVGLGGKIELSRPVGRLEELGAADVTLCDVTPRQMLGLAGSGLSEGMRRGLGGYSYGPGAFKIDYALSEAIPWRAVECRRAGTVQVGGGMEEIALSEGAAWKGMTDAAPFVLVVQPSLFDTTRAPEGKHTAWAYCHVPQGSVVDRTEAIEGQMERFAPGFRECVLARRVSSPRDLEAWDANLVGGDLSGGAMTPWQMVMRPTGRLYGTGMRGVYLCSSSTPPGGGVHGMCGYLGAVEALKGL